MNETAHYYAVHVKSQTIAGKPRETMTAAEIDCIELIRAYKTSSDAFQTEFFTESEAEKKNPFGISCSSVVAK